LLNGKHITYAKENSLEEIAVGDTAELIRTVTEADVVNYAVLPGL
jgi:hypothetical protein